MITTDDVRALWSSFAGLSDSDIQAQLDAATQEVDEYLAGQGIDPTEENAPWSIEDREYAILRLAAHYLTVIHGLAPQSYSIGGISESFAVSREGLSQTVFGQQYLRFLKLKGEASLPLGRTG